MPTPTHAAYNYIVYRTFDSTNGELFHAEHSDGTPLPGTPQPTPDPVIQTALDQLFLGGPNQKGPGHVYIQTADPDVYHLSASFTGFNVSSFTRITMDPTTILSVPSAYTGPVFHLRATDQDPIQGKVEVRDSIIDGGRIRQDSNQCIGILLENAAITITSSGNPTPGVFFNKIMNTVIEGTAIGIQLSVTGPGGWINSNSFQSVKMYSCGVFIDFAIPDGFYPHPQPGQGANGQLGMHFNHFDDVQCQSQNGITVAGVQNIRHIGNMFVDVKIWDIPDGALSSNIHSDATNTLILGGILTDSFQDDGQFTKIFDLYQGLKVGSDTAIPAATRIGTSPPELLAFFGNTPVPQQPGSASGGTAGNSYGATEQDMLNAVYQALQAYGLI